MSEPASVDVPGDAALYVVADDVADAAAVDETTTTTTTSATTSATGATSDENTVIGSTSDDDDDDDDVDGDVDIADNAGDDSLWSGAKFARDVSASVPPCGCGAMDCVCARVCKRIGTVDRCKRSV